MIVRIPGIQRPKPDKHMGCLFTTNTWIMIGYYRVIRGYSFFCIPRKRKPVELPGYSWAGPSRPFSVLRLENWKKDWKAIKDRLCSESLGLLGGAWSFLHFSREVSCHGRKIPTNNGALELGNQRSFLVEFAVNVGLLEGNRMDCLNKIHMNKS